MIPKILVAAAIIKNGSKILIARRSPEKHLAGFWELPGGKVEENETPEDCLEREIREELGLKIKVGEFFKENEHRYDEKTIILKAYFCELVSGTIKYHDHDQVQWVNISEFGNFSFAPADVPLIKALIGE